MCISCSMTDKLNHFGTKYSCDRVNYKNEQNGYALLTCIALDPKNRYCVL